MNRFITHLSSVISKKKKTNPIKLLHLPLILSLCLKNSPVIPCVMLKYFLFVISIPLSITGIFGQKTLEKRLKAYVFLSDECPMCQGYAPVLNQLATDFKDKGVDIIGVFPNYYATDSSILAFKTEYSITFTTIKDSAFQLTNRFNASITPQVFLQNTEGSLLYAGQIDNAYFRAGKRRGTTSEYYLKSAIEAVLNNQKPIIEKTQSIGCVIVRD